MGIGSIGRKLFGGPQKSSSHSDNQAYGELNTALSPALGYVTGGGNMMGSMLGVNGQPAQLGALNNFANSGGMQFLQDQGMKGIESNKAAAGLLKSGSTLTAMDKYNQGLASTYLNQYMNDLNQYSNLGLNSAQAISGAGSEYKSNGEGQKPGIVQSVIGAIA